jgi:nucleoside diphosphate kinase
LPDLETQKKQKKGFRAGKIRLTSLRSLYGKNIVHNGVHASDTVESALYEVNIFFPHTLERRGTVVSDSRLGTNQNPYPAGYTASVEDLHSRLERTVALIKPDALQAGNKEAILKIIADKGYRIVAAKDVQMTPEQACEFYRDNSGKPWYDDLVSWISGSTVHALVLEKDSAVNSWRELIGPTSSEIAKSAAPHTLRAQFGTDSCKNAVHGSDSPSTVETEMKMLFGSEVSPDPEPLPSAEGEVEPVRASVIGRASVAKDAKDATKSAENILNMILAETKSQSNSKSNLSGSKGNLAGLKSNLGGSKSNLKSSGSKEQLKDKNPLGSKANLTGSKENLKSSGSKDNLKSSGSKDNLKSSGSKDNLNSSGSKEQLTDKKSSGSKVKIIESKDNLKTSGSNEKVKHAKENAAGSRATSAKSRPGSGLKKTADSKENVKKSSAALGSKNKLAASKKDVAAVPETSPEVAP